MNGPPRQLKCQWRRARACRGCRGRCSLASSLLAALPLYGTTGRVPSITPATRRCRHRGRGRTALEIQLNLKMKDNKNVPSLRYVVRSLIFDNVAYTTISHSYMYKYVFTTFQVTNVPGWYRYISTSSTAAHSYLLFARVTYQYLDKYTDTHISNTNCALRNRITPPLSPWPLKVRQEV